MSFRERAPVLRAIMSDFWARQQVPRTPEPSAVMTELDRVEAYAKAALDDEVMAPIYLFHAAQTAQLIRPGDTVVDLGCGPGTETAILARLHPQSEFIGVDLSAAMLARAQQHVEAAGLRNVDFCQADMTDLSGLPDQSVDVVVSTMALHHLPALAQLRRTLAEVHRVLRPEGGVYLADLARMRSAAAIGHLSRQYAHRQAEAFTKDYFDSLHAAFSREDLAASLGPLGQRAQHYCMRPVPFMQAITSQPRCELSPGVQAGLALMDDQLPRRHRSDLLVVRTMFRLGGLSSIRTKRRAAP